MAPKPQPLSLPDEVTLSRIRVYDSAGPDGQCGGTPHLHLACSELYVLVAGAGAVELIDRNGFHRLELRRDSLIGFTPGTVHRLINLDGMLEVLVIMQNAGLPERGDAAITFPLDVLGDADRYREAAAARDTEQARRRRDWGVQGFLAIRNAFERSHTEGLAVLDRVHRLSIERAQSKLSEWESVIREGPLRLAQRTMDQIAALKAGRTDALASAQSWCWSGEAASVPGMCGQITRFGMGGAAINLDGEPR